MNELDQKIKANLEECRKVLKARKPMKLKVKITKNPNSIMAKIHELKIGDIWEVESFIGIDEPVWCAIKLASGESYLMHCSEFEVIE
jgi:hypothetical protein